MSTQASVTVYNFKVYDDVHRVMRVERFKAPREVIAKRFGGEVLEGTGHKVPEESLDEHGRFRRVATGWGELS